MVDGLIEIDCNKGAQFIINNIFDCNPLRQNATCTREEINRAFELVGCYSMNNPQIEFAIESDDRKEKYIVGQNRI